MYKTSKTSSLWDIHNSQKGQKKVDLQFVSPIISQNLNRYSLFQEIANLLLLHYVKKFDIHGIEHAARTAIYIDIFNELHRKHSENSKPLIEDPELIKMLKIAALLHDAGRIEDTGHEESEKENAKIAYDVLITLGFDEARTKMIKKVMKYKDHPEKLTTKEEKNCRILLHSADCLDIIRIVKKFDPSHLWFETKYPANENLLARKSLFCIIENAMQVLHEMGDLHSSFKYSEKLIKPGKFEGYSLFLMSIDSNNNNELIFGDKKKVEEEIKKLKELKAYKNIPILIKKGERIYIYGQKLSGMCNYTELTNIDLYKKIKFPQSGNILAEYALLSKDISYQKHILLAKLAGSQVSDEIFKDIWEKRGHFQVEKISINGESNYSTEIKAKYTNSPTPYEDIYRKFCNNRALKEYLQNSFINIPVFYENDKDEINKYSKKHFIQYSEDFTTEIKWPMVEVPLEKLPYAEYYRQKKNITQKTCNLLLAKCNPVSPWVILAQNGFHPLGVLPIGILNEQQQKSRGHALDPFIHCLSKSFGSGLLSATNDINIAKSYAKRKGDNNSSATDGYVYIFNCPPGTIIINRSDNYSLVNIPGGFDQTNIIAYRKVEKRGRKFIFDGKLYIRENSLNKYDHETLSSVCALLLEPTEQAYLPSYTLKPNTEQALNNFLKKLTASKNENASLEQLISDYNITTSFIEYVNVTNDFEKLVEKLEKGKNQSEKLKICTLLAIKYKCVTLFTELLKIENNYDKKDGFIELILKQIMKPGNSNALKLILTSGTNTILQQIIIKKINYLNDQKLEELSFETKFTLLKLREPGIRKRLLDQVTRKIAKTHLTKSAADLFAKAIKDCDAEIFQLLFRFFLNHHKLNISNKSIKNAGTEFLAKFIARDHRFTSINLHSNNIGDRGAEAFAKALKTNNTLKELGFPNNNISDEGTNALADTLKTDNTLEILNLSSNNISDKGAKDLADALKINNTLKSLKLSSNNISDEGAKALADALKTNNTLEILSLFSNNISDEGAKELADTLKTNNTLEILSLFSNNISDEGAKELADALKTNNTLKILELSSNNISNEGAKNLADALKTNNTLEHLELSSNNISNEGAKAFVDALKTNNTLKSLYLPSNNISDETANALAKALKTNNTLKLRLFDNRTSDKGAEALAKTLKTNRAEFLSCWPF